MGKFNFFRAVFMLKDTTIKGYCDEWGKALREAFAESMHLQEDLINRKK